MKCLYVTWDAPEAPYLQSLFLPILAGLRAAGIDMEVLQFSWNDPENRSPAPVACEQHGIRYRRVNVFRGASGLGPFVSAIRGAQRIRSLVRTQRFDAVLARSTMPALATLIAARRSDITLAFDADGLPLDERVDFAGRDPRSFQQRLLRDVETQMLLRARAVLVRTAAAREIMIARAGAGSDPSKFRIVLNGRDQKMFIPQDQPRREEVRKQLQVDKSALLLTYAGSLGPQYGLTDMLRLTEALREFHPRVHLLLITGTPDTAMAAVAAEFPSLAQLVTAISAPPNEVPRYLAAADIGLAFRAKSFSMQGVAPIKIGEYLLCGLPIVGTAGIGDINLAVEEGVFFAVQTGNPQEIRAAAQWCVQTAGARTELSPKARAVGIDRFSLEAAVESYRAALAPLTRFHAPV